MKAAALVLLALAVFVLHQDFWNWKTHEPLIFGFLPIGLAYHAGFSILCACLMALMVKFAWPSELENIEAHTDKPGEAKP